MLRGSLLQSTRPAFQSCWKNQPSQQHKAPSSRMLRRRSVNTAQQTAPGLVPQPWEGTPEQLKALQDLKERMADSKVDEDTLKWYLRDRYFDVIEAEEKLKATLAWREGLRASQLTMDDVRAEFSTGKSYVHDKLDRYNRPVLVITARKHNTGEFPISDSKRLCTFMLETALSKLPPGGEQMLGVIDLKGISLSNIDLPFVVFMVDAFFIYYPRRMGQVLLVDAPWIFKGPWEVIKPLLRKYAALVRFVSRQELAQEYFTPETLPPDFR